MLCIHSHLFSRSILSIEIYFWSGTGERDVSLVFTMFSNATSVQKDFVRRYFVLYGLIFFVTRYLFVVLVYLFLFPLPPTRFDGLCANEILKIIELHAGKYHLLGDQTFCVFLNFIRNSSQYKIIQRRKKSFCTPPRKPPKRRRLATPPRSRKKPCTPLSGSNFKVFYNVLCGGACFQNDFVGSFHGVVCSN